MFTFGECRAAYVQGYLDAERGQPHNPHEPREEYERGWQNGQAELERERTREQERKDRDWFLAMCG